SGCRCGIEVHKGCDGTPLMQRVVWPVILNVPFFLQDEPAWFHGFSSPEGLHAAPPCRPAAVSRGVTAPPGPRSPVESGPDRATSGCLRAAEVCPHHCRLHFGRLLSTASQAKSAAWVDRSRRLSLSFFTSAVVTAKSVSPSSAVWNG